LNGASISAGTDIPAAQIGALAYVPNPEFSGQDSFDWTASDGNEFAADASAVMIDISPVNDPPTDINLSNNLVEEGQAPGKIVGTLSVEDIDNENDFDFSFSQNNGNDIDAFVIDGNLLKTDRILDYDIQNLYTILITATDRDGNEITREFTIEVLENEEEFFQTGITPNGDGHNDTWKIRGLENCADCVVEVFNRWGQRLFSSVGYDKEWDGTYNNEVLPAGTYYYVVDYKDGRQPNKGAITILK
jgi:gliding motility-associated-like protein